MQVKIHRRFKLNGISFSSEELKEVGYSLTREENLFEQSIGNFLLDWLNTEPIISVKTSGSTGKPKSVDLRKEHMVNSAKATGIFFNLKAGNTALLCLPAGYIAGKMMLVRAMVLGLELDYVEPSSYALINISKTYDFCAMIPLQLENSLQQIHQIKKIIVGGASISSELKRKIGVAKTEIFETYGMTETLTHIAVKKIADPDTVKTSTKAKNELCFKTLPSVTISTDKRNCLVIDAPNIMVESFVTNDLVNIISEFEFEWLGRYDNIINSGGIKLIPEHIEAKLVTIIDNPFFVAGLPDKKLGQRLVMIVEGEPDVKKLFQQLKSFKPLDKFEVPKEILSVPKFEKTTNGKILRKRTLSNIS